MHAAPDLDTAKTDDKTRWDRSILILGLIGGLGLGTLVLHLNAQSLVSQDPIQQNTISTTAETPARVGSESVGPSQRDATSEALTRLQAERAELERRVAELEVSRLKERLEKLETPTVSESLTSVRPERILPSGTVVPLQAAADSQSSTGENRGARSLAYWNNLNGIMVREAAMRKPPTQLTNENAGDFVAARGNASRFASDAIKQLDTTEVDPEVLKLSNEIAEWYDAGVALNGQASYLIGQADAATRRGATGRTWKGGEEQHRKTCLELNRRGAQVRTKMSQKYKLSFPELQ